MILPLRRLLAVSIILCLFVISGEVRASPIAFDLPAQTLGRSLDAVATKAGFNLVVPQKLVAGKIAPALHGQYEPITAFHVLLAGSGLEVTLKGGNAEITQLAAEINLAPVKVVGVEPLGANGSTDPTATENTGSYATEQATVGSKIPLAIKDTPQSVSVITQQRLQDQNLFSMFQALEEMPGVQVQNKTDDQTPYIYTRGFQIQNFQIDGGAGYTGYYGNNNTPNSFDLAEYDHIELIRGADGMFSGAGDPSGTINLVRKRPLDHFQGIGEFDGGSWHDFREVADITGPIALDGRIRARLVAANQDQHYFYDVANSHHTSIYGTVEADVTPSTLLTIGGSYAWYRDVPWVNGLPRYDNGTTIPYPRSQCICFPWGGNHYNNSEVFVKLAQRINDQWSTNLNFTTTSQRENAVTNAPFNTGDRLYAANTFLNSSRLRQYMLDANLHGSFDVFGQPQQVTVGGNYTYYKAGDTTPLAMHGGPTYVGLFPFDTDAVPATQRTGGGINEYNNATQFALYAMARVQPVSFIHLFGGFRLSGYDNYVVLDEQGYGIDSNSRIGSVFENGIITPYGGITVDLMKDLAAYFSYTNIFQPQTTDFSGPPPGTPLPPITGNTYELGLKGDLNNGKLKASAALYRTNQVNGAILDTSYPNSSVGLFGSCCYIAANSILSEGLDLEINGEVLPGWQVSGSATYNYNAQDYGPNKSTPYYANYPKYQWKLWTTYRLPDQLQDFTIGGGINGQSTIYARGNVGTVYNSASGDFKCPCVDYRFKSTSWTIFSLRGAWQVTQNVLAAVDVKNLLDKTYFQTTNSPFFQNWYGEPRSFMFTIRYKY